MQKPRKEGNRFDKILKENIELTVIPLLNSLTGIQFEIIERITEKLQTTTEREADYLALVKDEFDKEKMLHLEFQTRADQDMLFRIGEYHGILQRKYKLPILHIVLFLDKKPFSGLTRLEDDFLFKEFVALNIHSLSYTKLLASNIPEEIILAVLADFENREPEAVFRLIFQKLKQTTSDEPSLRKYLNQLANLSRLRNLTETFNQTRRTMTFSYDIKTDALFREGIVEGMQKGMQKGIALTLQVIRFSNEGFTAAQIAEQLDLKEKEVTAILENL